MKRFARLLVAFALVEAILTSAACSTPLATRDAGACLTPSSPINADSNYDWEKDVSIGTSNLRDKATLERFYASRYKAVMVNDSPILRLTTPEGRKAPPSRLGTRDDSSSLYAAILKKFSDAKITIAAAANQAYVDKVDNLRLGYKSLGPDPPANSGLCWCSQPIDTYAWCNCTTGQMVQDDISHQDNSSIAVPASESGVVCLTSASGPCPNVTFSSITSHGGSSTLHHAPNGNIYSFDDSRCATDNLTAIAVCHMFAGTPPFILGDAQGRILHGYNDTMVRWNVSRLRVSSAEAMPNTALPVALVSAMNPSSSTSIMTAVDTSSNTYVLITCETDVTYPKVFLATDYEQGIAMLMDPDLGEEVTGGCTPKQCYAVPYTNGRGPL